MANRSTKLDIKTNVKPKYNSSFHHSTATFGNVLLCLVFLHKSKKMELIKELEKQDKANSREEYRMLKAVKAGNYKLAIQGSSGHYCSPRQTLPVNMYVDMELAIINKKGSMVSANRSSKIRQFKRYNELIDRADSLNSSATVYGYVSVDLLNDLYCFLNEA